MPEIIASILSLFNVFIGPFGGLLISVSFNIIFIYMIIYGINFFFGIIKQKDQYIQEMSEDLKLLVLKSQVVNDDFKKIVSKKKTK